MEGVTDRSFEQSAPLKGRKLRLCLEFALCIVHCDCTVYHNNITRSSITYLTAYKTGGDTITGVSLKIGSL